MHYVIYIYISKENHIYAIFCLFFIMFMYMLPVYVALDICVVIIYTMLRFFC